MESLAPSTESPFVAEQGLKQHFSPETFFEKFSIKVFLLHQTTGSTLVWGFSGLKVEFRAIPNFRKSMAYYQIRQGLISTLEQG